MKEPRNEVLSALSNEKILLSLFFITQMKSNESEGYPSLCRWTSLYRQGMQSPSQQECPSQGGTLIVGSHKTRTESDSLCFMEYVRNLTERTLKESKDLAGRGEERAFWAGGTGCAGEQRWVKSCWNSGCSVVEQRELNRAMQRPVCF